MNKTLLVVLAVLSSQSLFGGLWKRRLPVCCEVAPPMAGIDKIHFDGRIAAFIPTGDRFRSIYGSSLAAYEFEIGKIFAKHYEVWANVDYVTTSGSTPKFHSKTSYRSVNLSGGAKYVFRFHPQGNLYLGLGINGAFVHVHNSSSFVKRDVNKDGVGGVAKVGVYFEPTTHLFMEFFVDYLYQTIQFQSRVQVGGVKIGGGIGACF